MSLPRMTYDMQVKCINTQQHSIAYRTDMSKFANNIPAHLAGTLDA